MSKVDALLEARMVLMKSLARKGATDARSQIVRDATERQLAGIDAELRMAQGDGFFQADMDAASRATEKASMTGDYEAAERESTFYMVRAQYRHIKARRGAEAAERMLVHHVPDIGEEYANHVRQGTIPEF